MRRKVRGRIGENPNEICPLTWLPNRLVNNKNFVEWHEILCNFIRLEDHDRLNHSDVIENN